MKVILSRKGFDSTYGGVASPILPDGSLCPLPIPSPEPPRLKDVIWRGDPLSGIVSAITRQRIGPHDGVHLDPDLQEQSRPRAPGWRPLFGQVDSAQSHLTNRGIGVGDVFLFFGWFRPTARVSGRLVFERNAPDLHVIFGWLQVGRVLHPTIDRGSVPHWAAEHPHVRRARSMSANNTLYVASRELRLPSVAGPISGAGVFTRPSPVLTLTAEAQGRSLWRLPRWFYPTPGKPPLTYHSDARRWRLDSTGCYLQTVGRGQEFVLDCNSYPEAFDWLRDIFTNGADHDVGTERTAQTASAPSLRHNRAGGG
jgi:hypothetical protein